MRFLSQIYIYNKRRSKFLKKISKVRSEVEKATFENKNERFRATKVIRSTNSTKFN